MPSSKASLSPAALGQAGSAVDDFADSTVVGYPTYIPNRSCLLVEAQEILEKEAEMLEEVVSIAKTAGPGERWVVEQSAVVLAAVARHLRRIGSECRTPIARELYDFDRAPYPRRGNR